MIVDTHRHLTEKYINTEESTHSVPLLQLTHGHGHAQASREYNTAGGKRNSELVDNPRKKNRSNKKLRASIDRKTREWSHLRLFLESTLPLSRKWLSEFLSISIISIQSSDSKDRDTHKFDMIQFITKHSNDMKDILVFMNLLTITRKHWGAALLRFSIWKQAYDCALQLIEPYIAPDNMKMTMADLTFVDGNGWTAMHYVARMTDNAPFLNSLLEKGGDPDCRDHCNRNPLWHAVRFENYSIMECLIGQKIEVSPNEPDGEDVDSEAAYRIFPLDEDLKLYKSYLAPHCPELPNAAKNNHYHDECIVNAKTDQVDSESTIIQPSNFESFDIVSQAQALNENIENQSNLNKELKQLDLASSENETRSDVSERLSSANDGTICITPTSSSRDNSSNNPKTLTPPGSSKTSSNEKSIKDEDIELDESLQSETTSTSGATSVSSYKSTDINDEKIVSKVLAKFHRNLVKHIIAEARSDGVFCFPADIYMVGPQKSQPSSNGAPKEAGKNKNSRWEPYPKRIDKGKRRAIDGNNNKDDNDNDEDGGDGQNPPPIHQGCNGLKKIKKFLCPYGLLFPDLFPLCRDHPGYIESSRLKDHLGKVHKLDPRCPRCGKTFQTRSECDTHNLTCNGTGVPQLQPSEGMMTQDQFDELKKRPKKFRKTNKNNERCDLEAEKEVEKVKSWFKIVLQTDDIPQTYQEVEESVVAPLSSHEHESQVERTAEQKLLQNLEDILHSRYDPSKHVTVIDILRDVLFQFVREKLHHYHGRDFYFTAPAQEDRQSGLQDNLYPNETPFYSDPGPSNQGNQPVEALVSNMVPHNNATTSSNLQPAPPTIQQSSNFGSSQPISTVRPSYYPQMSKCPVVSLMNNGASSGISPFTGPLNPSHELQQPAAQDSQSRHVPSNLDTQLAQQYQTLSPQQEAGHSNDQNYLCPTTDKFNDNEPPWPNKLSAINEQSIQQNNFALNALPYTESPMNGLTSIPRPANEVFDDFNYDLAVLANGNQNNYGASMQTQSRGNGANEGNGFGNVLSQNQRNNFNLPFNSSNGGNNSQGFHQPWQQSRLQQNLPQQQLSLQSMQSTQQMQQMQNHQSPNQPQQIQIPQSSLLPLMPPHQQQHQQQQQQQMRQFWDLRNHLHTHQSLQQQPQEQQQQQQQQQQQRELNEERYPSTTRQNGNFFK